MEIYYRSGDEEVKIANAETVKECMEIIHRINKDRYEKSYIRVCGIGDPKDKNILITIMSTEKDMKNVTEILRDLI